MEHHEPRALRKNDLGAIEARLRRVYRRWLAPWLRSDLGRQRLKLCWRAWGYGPFLTIAGLGFTARLRLLSKFLRIDWHVPLAHYPSEIAAISAVLAERRALPGELVVEAGCWQGGSTSKFSLICAELGYGLVVYDSFQGVEPGVVEGYDFSGEYAAPLSLVRGHVAKFGEPSVCSFVQGWFADTIASQPPPGPVRLLYIDCDLAKGTIEVLRGTLPVLARDGWIFSQDFHIPPIQDCLLDSKTWQSFGRELPTMTRFTRHLCGMRFTTTGA